MARNGNKKVNTNIFESLSTNTPIRSEPTKVLTQPKISQFTSARKRVLDNSDFPELSEPHKRANLSSNLSPKSNEVIQPNILLNPSSELSSNPSKNTSAESGLSHVGLRSNENEVVSEQTQPMPAPGFTKNSLKFSEELQIVGNLFSSEQATEKDRALLSLLNRVCEQMESNEKEIESLKKEIIGLKQELGLQINRSKREGLNRSESVLKEEVEKSMKTLRIIGVKAEGKSNTELIKDTVNKLKDPIQASPPSLENVKVFKKKGSDLANIIIRCSSADKKHDFETRGRKAGLTIRQNLPSTLVKTASELRVIFNHYATGKNCIAMVKLGQTSFEIHTKPINGGGGWNFFESVQLPYSKHQLKLNGGKQRMCSKFVDLSKVHIPNHY